MKLRLVLFLSSSLLFCSLSFLSLNAQQERETRLWLSPALPTLSAKGAKPEFGPNVMVFDPSMSSQAIQKQIDAVYATQEHNEFGQQRNALLFLPGDYSVDVPVGFYTEVIGLGASPDATRIAGNMHAPKRHRLRNRPLHRAPRRLYREPFRSSPEGCRRIIVLEICIRVHVARNPCCIGRRPKPYHLRVKAHWHVYRVVSRQE